MRVGIGFDVHKLVEGRKLIIGGVEIPFEKGLLGHSDADVLLHAIKDSLLGAASLGDIGRHFPDSEKKYKDADSLKLLKEVNDLLLQKNYIINNLDAIIIAERPKMAPFIEKMRENLARSLKISLEQVNIKATTTEGLGCTGRGEGIAAQAVVSIKEVTNAG
jgi:2-C-methyl-D-erythritol 2,4-cyclodiphosphate synthase